MSNSRISSIFRGAFMLGMIAALVLVLGGLPGSASAAPSCTTDCYVSPTGDNNNAGDAANPLLTIQAAVNQVSPGGTVHVAAGTYTESPKLNKSVVLQSTSGRDSTIINLVKQPIASTYLGSIQIDGDDVTVDGFTIVGFNADCVNPNVDGDQPYASTNIILTLNTENVTIKNNRLKVGQVGACNSGDDGLGIATYYTYPAVPIASLVVENNIFEPATASGGRRAFYVNPGTVDFTFRNNTINGQFTALSVTQAKNGLVEGNTITGTGSSGGIGTWGYPVPSEGYGKTTFKNNTITGVVNGIAIYETNDVVLEKNTIDGNQNGVRVTDLGLPYDPSTIQFLNNAITNNTVGVTFTTTNATLNASCTWWGAETGPETAALDGQIDYSPWLTSSDLDAHCGPKVALEADTDLICGTSVEMTIDFSDVADLYGYQFKVSYAADKATAVGAFDNGWFNTAPPTLVPPGWSASCSAGTCNFAASLTNPANPLDTIAAKTVAKITFNRAAAGSFTATVSDVVLTNLDGETMPVSLDDATFDFDVCGQASVSGKVSLQGRATPMSPGFIKLIDTSNTFPAIDATFDAAGNFNVPNIPVMAGGTPYVIQATHYLYLGNQKALPLNPGDALTGQNTRLLGGDANNSGFVFTDPLVVTGPNVALGVSVADVGCIGSDFGGTTSNTCNGATGVYFDNSGTDINADGKINIQDLSIAGGNFEKNPFQNW